MMRYARANDRRAPGPEPSGPPELAPALGTWFNCNPRTGEIVRLELSEHGSGLRMRAFGADDDRPIDWGEVAAEPHVDSLASRVVTGFTARYDFRFMETQIAANLKYGVLVIQSYNRFVDGSGRPCYFTREFFHQRLGAPPTVSAPTDPDPAALPFRTAGDLPASGPGPGEVDLSPLLGRWRNTYRDSKGVVAVELGRDGRGYAVEAWGLGYGPSWGKVPAHPHAPNASSGAPAGFLAAYAFGFADVLFSANESKGLLIIATFTTFRDGSGRSSYFTREFYYREPPVPGGG